MMLVDLLSTIHTLDARAAPRDLARSLNPLKASARQHERDALTGNADRRPPALVDAERLEAAVISLPGKGRRKRGKRRTARPARRRKIRIVLGSSS